MSAVEPQETRLGAVDLRLLPAYLAVLSSLSLLWTYTRNRGAHAFEKSRSSTSSNVAVMSFQLARLAGVLALLVISAFDVAVHATVLAEITVILYVGTLCLIIPLHRADRFSIGLCGRPFVVYGHRCCRIAAHSTRFASPHSSALSGVDRLRLQRRVAPPYTHTNPGGPP